MHTTDCKGEEEKSTVNSASVSLTPSDKITRMDYHKRSNVTQSLHLIKHCSIGSLFDPPQKKKWLERRSNVKKKTCSISSIGVTMATASLQKNPISYRGHSTTLLGTQQDNYTAQHSFELNITIGPSETIYRRSICDSTCRKTLHGIDSVVLVKQWTMLCNNCYCLYPSKY